MQQSIQPDEIPVNEQRDERTSPPTASIASNSGARNIVTLTGVKYLQFALLRSPLRVIVLQMGRRNGSRKKVTLSTEKARLTNVERCVRVSLRDDLDLPSIYHLGEPHVANFMRWLSGNNCSRPYIANAFTDLRHFLETGLGKQNVLFDLKHYIGAGSLLPIPKKSLRGITGRVDAAGAPLIAETLISRVRAVDVRAALILQLCLSLGLSISEAFRFRPQSFLSAAGDVHIDGANADGRQDRTVRPELVLRFHKLAISTIDEAKQLCPMSGDTIYRDVPPWRVRSEFSNAVKYAGIVSADNDMSVDSFREEYLREVWLAGRVLPPHPIAHQNDDSRVVVLALQICLRQTHFVNTGGRSPLKLASHLAAHFRQVRSDGVTRSHSRRAMRLFVDIKFGDMCALESRRLDLLALQAGTLSMRALEDKINENFLNGTQHRMQ